MEQELLKLGIAGIICCVLIWVILKSEKREAQKDIRIQMLENLLIESYGERIAAAEQIATAMHTNANAIIALTHEIRAK